MRSPEKVTSALADTVGESGSVAALVYTINNSPSETARHAAKALKALLIDSSAVPGAVRAVLQVFISDIVGPSDVAAIERTLKAIVLVCPGAPAQLISAYTDPDPWVSFAAIFFSQKLFACSAAAKVLLEAGAGKALVAALSHPSPYCRSAAAALPEAPPDFVADALQEAGLIPALVAAVLSSPPESNPLPPCLPRFTDGAATLLCPRGHYVTVPFTDPTLMACVALSRIAASFPWVAREMFLAGGARALMHGLRESRLQVASAEILCAILDSPSCPPRILICEDLVAEGLPALLPSLITPEQPRLAPHTLVALLNISALSFDKRLAVPVDGLTCAKAAVVNFLESDDPDAAKEAGVAFLCVYTVTAACKRAEGTAGQYHGQLSAKLVKKACRALITGDWEAILSLRVVMTAINEDTTGGALEAAVSGGFIPGVVRMLKGVSRSTFPANDMPSLLSTGYYMGADGKLATSQGEAFQGMLLSQCKVQVQESLLKVADAQPPYLTQAVKCGVLSELRGLLKGGTQYAATVVCRVSTALLRTAKGLANIREEGLAPSLLVELADSPHPGVVLEFGRFLVDIMLYNTSLPHREDMLREVLGALVAAGVMEKLKRALQDAGVLTHEDASGLGSELVACPGNSVVRKAGPGKRGRRSEKVRSCLYRLQISSLSLRQTLAQSHPVHTLQP